MKTQGNDTIYPTVESGLIQGNHVMECTREGLTKREYFAAMSMQGLRSGKLIASAADGYHQRSDKIWPSDRIAKLAVEDANALIEALNKEATHE